MEVREYVVDSSLLPHGSWELNLVIMLANRYLYLVNYFAGSYTVSFVLLIGKSYLELLTQLHIICPSVLVPELKTYRHSAVLFSCCGRTQSSHLNSKHSTH